MIQLKLTEQQAETLYNLLDVAVKAGGLQASKAALPIVDQLMEAAKAEQANDDQQEIRE
jgi:hypothetical protein